MRDMGRVLAYYVTLVLCVWGVTGCVVPRDGVSSSEVGRIDFEDPAQASRYSLNGSFASVGSGDALSGASSLLINTIESPDEWNACFRTAPGILKPGNDYQVSFKCRNLRIGDDSYLLFLIRPFDANDGFSDRGQIVFDTVGAEKAFKLPFHVPEGAENYSFQIHTRKRASAVVDDISIVCGPGKAFYPATADASPNKAPAIPKGADEFSIELPKPAKQAVVSAADFGVRVDNPDNTKALNDTIRHCAEKGASRLSVPKGVYRFTSDTTIQFEKLADFEFDGQGSTFVFLKERGDLVRILGCERTLFKDFNIDWDWDKDPLASVVRVESVAPDGGYADFRFVDYESFPKKDLRVGDIEQLDPGTMSVGCEGAVNMGFETFRGRSPVPKTEWLSGNLLRVFADGGSQKSGFARRLQKDMLFRMRHYVYDMAGVVMRDNAHLTLSGVNVYSCPSHAFVSSGMQHHWQFLNTNVIRPPGTKRPITCAADHHHVAQSLGYYKMEGCEFSLGGDDCLNVHDCTGFASKTGRDTVTTRNFRSIDTAHVGDSVELRNDDYSPTGFTGTITSKREIDGAKGIHEISFDKELPEPRGAGFIMFNRRYNSGHVIIRNCYFHDNRARGLLLLGSDMTVENNRLFHNQMGGIKIETGYTFDVWSEGYGASNIVIRNNLFDTVNPMGCYPNECKPTIYMSVYLKTDPSAEKTQYPILRDILVEGNRFVNCPGAIAYACSAENVIIRGNVIENSIPRRENNSYRGSVGTAYSSGVFVTGNTWIRSRYSPNPGVYADEETTKDIYCWDNKVVEEGVR